MDVKHFIKTMLIGLKTLEFKFKTATEITVITIWLLDAEETQNIKLKTQNVR